MIDVATAGLRDRLAGELPRLTDRVVALAEINSGSRNPAGVDRVGDRLGEMVGQLAPDSIERIEVDPTPGIDDAGAATTHPVGRALRAVKRPDAPFQVCLFGHLDTVFPADDPFQAVTVDGARLAGPGVADCKGGLVLALEVLAHLDTVPWGSEIGWEYLVVPDEEIGSIGSKPLLREAAAAADLGLGFEPALPSGGVAAARKGSVSGHLIVRGVAAHVGRAHRDGRSAILALSRLIAELEAHNARDGVTVNCGRITGGGALNVVPDLAIGSFNLRVEAPTDQTWIQDRFAEAATAASEDGVEVELRWASTRPPKVRTPALDRILADVTAAGAALGVAIDPEDTGGCCDGNDLAAAGLTNVDSLGIAGGGIHSPAEFAMIDSVPPRAATVAEVIRRAAARAAATPSDHGRRDG
ncbi:MAG: hydrolase [Actinomycetota bacterium]